MKTRNRSRGCRNRLTRPVFRGDETETSTAASECIDDTLDNKTSIPSINRKHELAPDGGCCVLCQSAVNKTGRYLVLKLLHCHSTLSFHWNGERWRVSVVCCVCVCFRMLTNGPTEKSINCRCCTLELGRRNAPRRRTSFVNRERQNPHLAEKDDVSGVEKIAREWQFSSPSSW